MFSTQKRRLIATTIFTLMVFSVLFGALGPTLAGMDAWLAGTLSNLANTNLDYGARWSVALSRVLLLGGSGVLLLAGFYGVPAKRLLTLFATFSGGGVLLAIVAGIGGGQPGLVAEFLFAVSALACAQVMTRADDVPLEGSEQRAHVLISAGRLDAAFSELKACPPSGRSLELFYHLAESYEKKAKVHQARRVLRFLANRAISRTQKTLQAEPTAELPPGIPQTLGRYDIEGLLGRGAMGAVYLARDTRINRSVALKVVSLDKEFDRDSLDDAKTRFFQEAESAGRLHHPEIVTIYDAGEVGGLSYIAMEHVTGKALSDVKAAREHLGDIKLIELCARAAEALAYAHERKVIHRDIKPANLLYDRDNDSLKIMDFGVAQLTDVVRTRTGVILGTPAYMSPEQLMGETIRGHSDLYSLGVTLYELLTGEIPFKADNMVGFAKAVTAGKARPVSLLRADLPRTLDKVINKALAKKPSQRFANGWEMADALRDSLTEFETKKILRSANN